jgi:hypothetical protein
MGLLFVLIALLSPRLGIVVLWAFTNYIDRSFNGFLVPLLGLLFLPWTTLMYVLVQAPAGRISFWGWLFVGIGVILDMSSYGQAATQGKSSGGSAVQTP